MKRLRELAAQFLNNKISHIIFQRELGNLFKDHQFFSRELWTLANLISQDREE
jgi:hypothetical protein